MRLGVTGGIGSGKSTVCRVFSILGAPVFSADEAARIIMDTDPDVIKAVNDIVGKNVYSNGKLLRRELAELIFNNTILLEKINSLVHPLIFRQFEDWEKSQDYPYVIMEAAILFESGADKMVDKILTVTAPEEERIMRIQKRNNLTREEIIARIKNQFDDEFRIKRSDYVVDNSGHNLILPRILEIHRELLLLAGNNQSLWVDLQNG